MVRIKIYQTHLMVSSLNKMFHSMLVNNTFKDLQTMEDEPTTRVAKATWEDLMISGNKKLKPEVQ